MLSPLTINPTKHVRLFGRRNRLHRRGQQALPVEVDPSLTVWPDRLSVDASVPAVLQIATVYRCVRLLSESVAKLPLLKMRLRDADIYEPDRRGREWWLLEIEPNSTINAFDFWRQTVTQILLNRVAYIVPQWSLSDGELESLVLLNAGTVGYDSLSRTYSVNDVEQHVVRTLGEEDIIVLKGYGPGQTDGWAITTFCKVVGKIARAGDIETLYRFETGGNVRGFITNEGGVYGMGEYQDSALETLAGKVWDNIKRRVGISSMPGKAEFHPWTLNSSDMQFLESRKFTVREICRFFGVHPSFVFDDSSNNYKSAEMANVSFLSDTLSPMLSQIECELRRKLLTPEEGRYCRYRFDRDALHACDLTTQMTYQEKRIAAGIDTPNEARRRHGKLPVEGGDVQFVSANLKPVTELAQTSGPEKG